MSSASLTKTLKGIVDDLTTTKEWRQKKVIKHVGQLHVWNVANFRKGLRGHMRNAGIGEKEIKQLVKQLEDMYRTLVQAQENSFKTENIRRYNEVRKDMPLIMAGLTPSAQKGEPFIVKNFGRLNKVKMKVALEFNKLTNLPAKLVTGAAKGGLEGGWHYGHGEEGLAASSLKVATIEQRVNKLTPRNEADAAALTQLKTALTRYKETVKISADMDMTQLVTAKGELRKNYIPVITLQDALENAEDNFAFEKPAMDALRKDFGDVLNMEGSTTLRDAIESVTMYNLAGKPSRNKKVSSVVKRKPVHKNKSKAKKITKTGKRDTSIPVMTGTGLSKSMKVDSREPAVSSGTINLAALINKKLPETVAGKMGPPKLENRTGTFAQSVRVEDIRQTPQGFPSIGYTYEKNPYQVFEMGKGKAPWANTNRDPRKLINASIREIAAEVMKGKFFTRRV